jgi:4-amino-4-deoxy-L-arabinose transferase-like glycosyltransferase
MIESIRARAGVPLALGEARPAADRARWLAALALGGLLLLALALRLHGLPALNGTLDIDESRLTLAAQGVLTHGWPVLPSGKVYTRGLVPSYLMAPSLALPLPLDLAARLPSVLAGVGMVAAIFLYARRLAGVGAGLLAAALVATAPPLVEASRQAWLYAILLLLWLAGLALLDRAIVAGCRRALLLGSTCLGLALLTHELTFTLLPAAGLALLLWLGRARWTRDGLGSRLAWLALGLLPLAIGLGLMVLFSLRLRADTAVGAWGEVRGFFAPRELADRLFWWSTVFGGPRWLLGLAALAGLLLAEPPLRWRLSIPLLGLVAYLSMLTLLLSVQLSRYAVPALPLLHLLAGVGLALAAARLRRLWPDRGVLVGLTLAGLVLAAQLQSALLEAPDGLEEGQSTWITTLRQAGLRPGDPVITNMPTVGQLYLGRADFWLASQAYELFTWEPDGQRREIHTNALLVRDLSELERLVAEPNRGRTVWVVARRTPYHWRRWVDEDLREQLEASARRRWRTAEWLLLELRL